MDDPDAQQRKFLEVEKKLGALVALCEHQVSDPVKSNSGSLAGVRVGVKDIIDVAGVPTRNGSAICSQAEPASKDAPVIARLRSAGASILGKTTTTEFAFTDPTNCRNPHDLQRSPGGSSSGSGAAVAAGLVDIALGTQTAGSLCRPAAYCGVVGLKPSYGLLPTGGVTPLAPSFDTVGIITRSVETAQAALNAVMDGPGFEADGPLRTATLLLPTVQTAQTETLAAFSTARAALSETVSAPQNVVLDMDVDAIVQAHRSVMLAEALQAHGAGLETAQAGLLRPNFRAALERATTLSVERISEARAFLADAKRAFWRQMASADVILTLPVPDGAPLLDGTTGFQDWLTPWTVFGGPLVSLPWGIDTLGRPRAVMLAGHPGSDAMVLNVAARLEKHAPLLPQPKVFYS
ncbi:MAG: amidase [Roseobacter sp.]